MTLTIAAIITAIQFWLRLATFLHGPLKSFLLHVLHNLSNDPTYNGLPQDPQKLYQALSTDANHQKKIKKLTNGKNGKKKVLQQDQVDALLPPTGNATDSSQFDVTLICILIINFTDLPTPLNGWRNKNPPATDLSIGAFVIRAREWRNYIHHTDPDKINQTEFNQKWIEGEQIINNLGFTYDTTQLKTMSLDLKYENVVKSLYLYLERKQETLSKQQTALADQQTALVTKQTAQDTKHTTLANKQTSLENQQASLSQDVTDFQISTTQKIDELAQQLSLHQNLSSEEIKALTKRLEEIANVQQSMHKNLPMMKHHSGSCCLDEVLEYISQELTEKESKKLLRQLRITDDNSQKRFSESLEDVSWIDLKRELHMMGKYELVGHIIKKTLITKGRKAASDGLHRHYVNDLIHCLVEQPLSQVDEDTNSVLREDVFIDLVVLPSSTVDKEWSNSDRAALMEQQ